MATARVGCKCTSGIPATAFPKSCSTRCSIPSSAVAKTEWASDCRFRTKSCSNTAAGSTPPMRRPAAACSPLPFPINKARIMHRALVVDDEENVRYSFQKMLREPTYKVLVAADGMEALAAVQHGEPDLAILDIQMPGMSGLEVLEHLQRSAPNLPVLVITAHGDSERVISAMKHGAYDYIEKPFDIPRMKCLIDDALEVGRLNRAGARAEHRVPNDSPDRIIGNSSAIQEVCKLVGRVAASDANVLLVGESGTGKELVARAIYQHGRAAGTPFLAVNCAAIPDALLESELFGYERGAFTGAVKRRAGKFELANGGTLFLDEIGDMCQATQAKVLRVLQDG